MKKKILIGAFALVSLLGGTFAYETFSGQNEAEASCVMFGTTKEAEGRCLPDGPGYRCVLLTQENYALGTPCRMSGGGQSILPQ